MTYLARFASGPAACRLACFVITLVLAQTFLWAPSAPLALKLVVVAVAVLSALRPRDGLLVVAALVPFGRVTSEDIVYAGPARFTEAMVLAFLAGWLLTRVLHPEDEESGSPAMWLAYAFAAVVVASLLVEIGILRYWKDYWWPFTRSLSVYVARNYLGRGVDFRPWGLGMGGLVAAAGAAVFLEGIGIMMAARRLCAGQAVFRRRLLGVLVLGAVGAAVLSVTAALQATIAAGRPLFDLFEGERFAVHTPKVNTAGSYFVLIVPIAASLLWRAGEAGRRPEAVWRLRWVAVPTGIVLMLMALWMTQSRSAMLAGFVVVMAASMTVAATFLWRRTGWRTIVTFLSACAITAAFFVFALYEQAGTATNRPPFTASLAIRLRLLDNTVRMLAAYPTFGAGIGQFALAAGSFDPDKTTRIFLGDRYSAHNQFMQTAAELGLIGGALFVAMIAVILWRAWKAFRKSHDVLLGGVLAGLAAFLITCLSGQPLLVPVVGIPFWLVLGVALAADPGRGERDMVRPRVDRRTWARVVATLVVVLAVSVPIRVWLSLDRVNLALAAYGFSPWSSKGDDRPYRVVSDRGTFFVYPQARRLELPIRRDTGTGRRAVDVDVLLDGGLARKLTLKGSGWEIVRFDVPAGAQPAYRRVDLEIRAPADGDARVRVGKWTVERE